MSHAAAPAASSAKPQGKPAGILQKRLTLLALIAITIAPVAASYLAYYYWKPEGGKSYGKMLEIAPVPQFKMATMDGQPAQLAQLKGKWLIVMADTANCEKSCQDSLFAIRQFRLAQGKDMGRVERLWLVTDEGTPSADAITRADGAQLRRALQSIPLPGAVNKGIYIIDPLGNQVLRYERDVVPNKVIKELGKLLKNNEALG